MTLQNLEHIASVSGGVLYVIVALSLVALTVIVERAWVLSMLARRGAVLCDELCRASTLDRTALETLAQQYQDSPYGSLLEIARDTVGSQSDEQVSADLGEALMLQVPRIDRGLWLLDTAVTLGPLLGLLGTIVGIFSSFKVLGSPGAAPSQVTGGVAEALIATAAGLLVAIVGLVCFNGLQKRVRLVVHRLETVKLMLENRLTKAPAATPQEATTVKRNGTDGSVF